MDGASSDDGRVYTPPPSAQLTSELSIRSHFLSAMNIMPQQFSCTMLKEAAELKIDELSQAKDAFKCRYHSDVARSADNVITRVKALLEDITNLNPDLEDDNALEVIARYTELASDGHSVSQYKLLKFEEQIQAKLEKRLNRLDVSAIHVELLKEVLDAGENSASFAAKIDGIDLDGDFEVVETELDEVLEEFEKETFVAKDVDFEAIERYLSSVMTERDVLEEMRSDLAAFSDEILDNGLDIDQDLLIWCIADIVKNPLIGEEKKKTLEGYLQSPVTLRELASILKMKSVSHWEYRNIEKGLPVTVVRNPDGQFCIAIEECIVDMLFLSYMGIGWAMRLKNALPDVTRCGMSKFTGLSVEELNKREYFLGPKLVKVPEITPTPTCGMCHPTMPPPSPPPGMMMPPPPPPVMMMPPPPPPGMLILPRKTSRRKPARSWCPPPPPPPLQHEFGSLQNLRRRQYTEEFFMSRLPVEDGCIPHVKSQEDVQARLMKTLAVERKLREAFDGQAHVGSVHFTSLASSLPHQTVLTVLKFLGLSDTIVNLFERFLSAKLNIGPAVRGAPDRILPRARGIPDGHTLEIFFTEAVMFFLELVVHQKTGSYLYRLRDRAYFVGNREQHRAYREHVAKFADTLGLDFNFEDGNSIGFLEIDTRSTSICASKVVTYAREVKSQLNSCTTVLEWVHVWNKTVGTYQTHLFGPLANVFGQSHVVIVKESYKTIFDIVLSGVDLTEYVSQLLGAHLRPDLIKPVLPLEALIYLPRAYGGLGVKNPFITLSLPRGLISSPNDFVEDYLDQENTAYEKAAEAYTLLDAEARTVKIASIFSNDTARVNAALGPDRDLTKFMSKEEFTAHRECAPHFHFPNYVWPYSYNTPIVPFFTDLYADLLSAPIADIPCSDVHEIKRLAGKDDMKAWKLLSGEDRWVLQLYANECFEAFGGLEIWCGEHVPQEVLKIVRGDGWDADDDASSVSDMSEA
jgi:hypothetical protein